MHAAVGRRWGGTGVALMIWCCAATLAVAEDGQVTATVDPVTRHVHVRYQVPTDAADECVVRCAWSPVGSGKWRPAKVRPLLSETGLLMAPAADWRAWMEEGRIVERRAAGLERTAVFNPYPEAVGADEVDVDFRIQIGSPAGQVLATRQGRVRVDLSGVVYVEDWSCVLQKQLLATQPAGGSGGWVFSIGGSADGAVAVGMLTGRSALDGPLPALTYPLDLQGWYAVFVCTRAGAGAAGEIRLRLSGDEGWDTLDSRHTGEEVLWRWVRMDRQHLLVKQPSDHTGSLPARIDYVKLVPLKLEEVERLEAQYGEPDRLIAGYWEPYSWAFNDDVRETLQHRGPIGAFAEARVGILDTQIGRFGMKSVYETRRTDQLLYETIGDPVPGDPRPRTANVGRMQQYTNTLDATLRYAREFGLRAFANFGASNCYVGTPLQGDFSRAHPEWMRSGRLRFEVPEVRAYALGLVGEALEIGAPGVSIDFCRYPQTLDKPETGNLFLKQLRELADEFGGKRGQRVPILVRFPGKGVERWELFDYSTWARAGLVDYLCPSNIQGRHLHIGMGPYAEAVRGTKCTLLPAVDGLPWGLPMPGPFLWRVEQLYQAGAAGLYVYQADSRILGRPEYRRCLGRIASREGVSRFWEDDRQMRPRSSKGIYVSRPCQPDGFYHRFERVRVWLEGIEMGEVEFLLDGQLVNRCAGPPYLLGTEDRESDQIVPAGEHQLTVRARDGTGWLEQSFNITGGG